MEEQERRKAVTMSDLFEANRKEKEKQEKMVGCLQQLEKIIEVKKNNLADCIQRINEFNATVSDQRSSLDQMKSVGADLKEKLFVSRKVIVHLEKEKAFLTEACTTTKACLDKVEGFTAGYSEISEDTL